MNPQNGRQHNKHANYYANIQPPRTARNKATRAARTKRHQAARGTHPHRSNSSPAAKARQLRRKERNANPVKTEKVFEHNTHTGITSFALIHAQPEE